MIKRFSLVFTIRLVAGGALLAQALLIANLLDVNAVGAYFLGASLVTLLATLSRFGLDLRLVSDLSRQQQTEGQGAEAVFQSQLLAVFFFCCFCLFLVVSLRSLLTGLLSESAIKSLTILIWAIFPISLANIFAEYYKYKRKPFLSILSRNSLSQILNVVALLVACLFVDQVTLALVCWLFVGCSLMGGLFSYVFISTRLRFSFEQLTKGLRAIVHSIPLFAVAISALMVGWVDLILIGMFAGDEEAAVYSVAVRLSSVISLIGMAILTLNSAVIAKAVHAGDRVTVDNELRKTIKLSGAVSALFILLYVGFGVPLLGLFGEEYLDAYWLLIILSVAHLVNLVFGPVGFLMVCYGHQKLFGYWYVLVSLLSVLALYILIPLYGGYAAAFIAILTFLAINSVCTIFLRRRYLIYFKGV